MSTPGTWWTRNRLWLALLVPLLALALAATAFRLVRLYLPWSYTQAVTAHGTPLAYDEDAVFDGQRVHRSVTIEALGVREVSSADGHLPAPGAHLLAVSVSFAAASDQMLDACSLYLVGPDGTLYGTRSGQVSDGSGGYDAFDCVPADAPGPRWDVLTHAPTPVDVPRPAAWTTTALVAVPAGVSPTRVRIQWQEPRYALLDLPR